MNRREHPMPKSCADERSGPASRTRASGQFSGPGPSTPLGYANVRGPFAVPAGQLRIAQRFSVGKTVPFRSSPEGTAETGVEIMAPTAVFGGPFGTCPRSAANPTLKRWAILDCPSGTAVSANSRVAPNLTRILHAVSEAPSACSSRRKEALTNRVPVQPRNMEPPRVQLRPADDQRRSDFAGGQRFQFRPANHHNRSDLTRSQRLQLRPAPDECRSAFA